MFYFMNTKSKKVITYKKNICCKILSLTFYFFLGGEAYSSYRFAWNENMNYSNKMLKINTIKSLQIQIR